MEHDLDFLTSRGFRFNPSPEEVVAYYLPSLIGGLPSVDTELVMNRASVYFAQPRDLAAEFRPVARSAKGDRWFFTDCRRIKGQGRVSRGAGGGTWVLQTNKDIKNREEGIKIGEVKTFRFKDDGKKFTDWLMEEYHLCGGGGGGGGGGGHEFENEAGDSVEPVVCRIYVSPRAPPESAARQESAVHPPPSPEEPDEPAPPNRDPAPQASHLKRPAAPAPAAEQPPPPPRAKIRGPATSRRVLAPPRHPVAPLQDNDDDVVRTIAPNDDEPHVFIDEILTFDDLERFINGDDNDSEGGNEGDSEVDDNGCVRRHGR